MTGSTRRLGPLAVLLVLFAGWSLHLAWEVAHLRSALSERVIWMIELQGVHRAIDAGKPTPAVELDWKAVERAFADDGQALLHVHGAEAAYEAGDREALPRHLHALVPAIRGQTGSISRDLGARWDRINLLVLISLGLGLALLAALWWAGRQLEGRQTAEEALALSEARHAKLGVGLALVESGEITYASTALERLCEPDDPRVWWDHTRAGRTHAEQSSEHLGDSCPTCGLPVRTGTTYATVQRYGVKVYELTWGGHAHELGSDGDLLLVRDVTEQRELEAQLRVADRLASVGTLAAGVAHEINNPLSYVVANLQVLARELGGPREDIDVEDMLAAIHDARDGANRVRTVVEDLQAFGHQIKEDGTVDVTEVVNSTARLADHHLRHRAELVLELGDVPRVRGVEARLGQVVLNLLVNAVQALPDDAEGHTITVASRQVGSFVELSVTDDGPGIPEENQPRIFDPFFTTKPVGVGTGLGLYVCHQIIGSMGGDLSVSSVPGCTADRPACSRGRDRPQAPSERWAAARGRRVLLIDDEPGVGRAFRRLLRDAEVTVAESLDAGVEAWNPSVDIVIVDLNLGDSRGGDILHRVPVERRRVVFLSGALMHDSDRALLDGHPTPLLRKPFLLDDVQRAIYAALLAPLERRAG